VPTRPDRSRLVIWFLFIGSRFRSTLPHYTWSPLRSCASLRSLWPAHGRTFTSKIAPMLGAHLHPMDKSRGFPSSDTHMTVGWVVRASQNPPSRRSGLTCPPRATTASPAAVLLAGPLAIGTNQGIHTCSSLNVLPTRAFPGGTPRTFSCEGAPPIYSTGVLPATVPPVGGAAIPMAKAMGAAQNNWSTRSESL